ncbi:MAG: ComEC/Rec2 family competence protein [Eubacteriales bacterium]|jgi:competence protein ComEC
MQLFHRRPLALVCAAFMAASLFGFCIEARFKYAVSVIIVAAALFCAVFFSLGRLGKKKFAMTAAASASALLGLLLSFLYFDVYYMSAQELCGTECVIEGVVLERRYTGSFSSGYSVRIEGIDGRKASYKAILDCEFVSDLQPGYAFSARAVPEKLGYLSYSTSDKRAQIADGFVFRCVVSADTDLKIVDEDRFVLSVWLSRLNRRVTALIESAVGGEEGRLAAAMALGRRDLLSESTLRDFRRTGSSHMLALSGMHMTILVGTAGLALGRLRFGRGVRCVLLTVFTLFYLALTGFHLSAARAAIMLILVYAAYIMAAQADPITSLFLACALIIAVSQSSVADAGLLLSFIATLGLIVGVTASREALDRLTDKLNGGPVRKIAAKALKCLATLIIATLSANLAVAIFTWLFFGELSMVTLLANIVLAPAATLLLAGVLLFLACQGLPAAAGIIARLIRLVSRGMLDFCAYFSGKEYAVVSLRYAFAGVIIIAMTMALAVLSVVRLRRKWIMLLPPAAAAAAFAICLVVCSSANAGNLSLTYLCERKNEMLVITSQGDAVICDISDGSRSNIGLALAAADREGVSEIKVYMLTHYHQKHIASTEWLLMIEIVRELWLPEPRDEREYGVMLSLVYIAEKQGCNTIMYKPGTPLVVFGSGALVADTAYIKRSTHPTVMLSLDFGDEKFTYVGVSVQESSLYPAASEHIAKSRDIVFGIHGPVTKTPFSYDTLARDIRTVVFAGDEIVAAFKYTPEQESLLSEAVLVRSPQARSFYYRGVVPDPGLLAGALPPNPRLTFFKKGLKITKNTRK